MMTLCKELIDLTERIRVLEEKIAYIRRTPWNAPPPLSPSWYGWEYKHTLPATICEKTVPAGNY
jgi:hypothetical protein